MSTRVRSTSSFVSILFWSSSRRLPRERLASMQSSSISMKVFVMCLRYSNFSGRLIFWVRSATRIMLRVIRWRSSKLSMCYSSKGEGRPFGGGRPLPDFQIARLPDIRDISGAEAHVPADTRAGVVAVEVEHTSGRTGVPGAPAEHAALGYAVIQPVVVALVAGLGGSLVRQQSQRTQQHLGGRADRSGAGDVCKEAAPALVCETGNGGAVCPLAAHIVQLHGIAGELRRAGNGTLRLHQRAVGGVDCLPAYARLVLRVVRIRGVVVGKDLEFAPYEADPRLPFPHVTVQIPDPAQCLVVAPCERAGASCYAAGAGDAVFGVFMERDRLVVAFSGVLAVVVVAVGHEAVLFAPEGDCGPLCISGEVPAVAFGFAASAGGVKVNIMRRILAGQAVRRRHVVTFGVDCCVYDVLVLGVVEAGDLDAIHDKGGVDRVVAAGQHVAVLKCRDIHQHGGEIGVVHLDRVVRAHAFECQHGKIKICHCHVLLVLFNAPENDGHVAHVERVLVPLYGGFLVHAVAALGRVLSFRSFGGLLCRDHCLGVGRGRDHNLRHIAQPGAGADRQVAGLIPADVHLHVPVLLVLGSVQHDLVVAEDQAGAALLEVDFLARVLFDHGHFVGFCHGYIPPLILSLMVALLALPS